MKTDLQVQQDVMAELKWEPAVHAAQIGVEVQGGVVTLAGEVSSYGEKLRAEAAAQRVCGVKAVAAELTVKLSQFGKRSDEDIAASARNILGATHSLPQGAVKLLVEDGWLTLSGYVQWQFQRQDAQNCVSDLLGVTGVSNQIAITPALSARLVKADIEAALKRRSGDEAHAIAVEVSGAEVTLSGAVHDRAERDIVTASAWGCMGVRKVIDKMAVVG